MTNAKKYLLPMPSFQVM